MGGREEGNLVVVAAAPLRLDHPGKQRTLTRGPVLRQQGARFARAAMRPKAEALGYPVVACRGLVVGKGLRVWVGGDGRGRSRSSRDTHSSQKARWVEHIAVRALSYITGCCLAASASRAKYPSASERKSGNVANCLSAMFVILRWSFLLKPFSRSS